MPDSLNPGPETRSQVIAEVQHLIGAGRLKEAMARLEPMTRRGSRDHDAWAMRAMVAEQQGDVAQMAVCAAQSVDLHPTPHGHTALATAYGLLGRTDEGLAQCEAALALSPGNPAVRFQKGLMLEQAGRYADAEPIIASLRAEIVDDRDPMVALLRFEWAKLRIHDEQYDQAVQEIDSMLKSERISDTQRSMALHLKAKALDRAGRYDDAFEAATQANALNTRPFRVERLEAQANAVMGRWHSALIDKIPLSTCQSDVPVFIAGMPRSGTSLLDQIIDAHPHAAGVGELSALEEFARTMGGQYDPSKPPPQSYGAYQSKEWTTAANRYVAQITAMAPKGAERVVNKALGNVILVGLLSRLFPKTRIIHITRDPRDVAVSCFMGGFNSRMFPWASRLDWIAAAWAQSQRLMDHWKAVLDVPILDVRYEDLVTTPETTMPELTSFLGLPWDDACARFHTQRRTVRTLSYDQVNRPLYTSSVGRWRHYASHLEGIDWPSV
ncbi:MAG: sulfotransferase [Phycisphaerales bacterium]|jgi:tetratricopeptide (TPR) repeat protein|nr:sulfotransferase [Phycisphaerales bacterium]